MLRRLLTLLAFCFVSSTPCLAQEAVQGAEAVAGAPAATTAFDMTGFANAGGQNQFNSSAAQGDMLHTTSTTGEGPGGVGAGVSSMLTGTQATVSLPTGLGQLTPGGLPETRLDSFVRYSGYNFMIYGDEGEDGPPPLFNFDVIGDAIFPGLTTGHGSALPSSWY